MFSLFDGVFKLNADSIVSQLKRSLLGDYSENIGEFVSDVKGDIVNTVTDWGKTWGLVEDKASDLDLLAEQAQDRMQPIVEKYRPEDAAKPPEAPETAWDRMQWTYGNAEPEEYKAPPEPELGEEMEMVDLNPGEEAIADSLNETLYELDEMDGKLGTEFYSIHTEEGLENTLKLLNDAKWDEGMQMVEINPELQAQLAEQRLQPEPLEFRSVQLESVLSNDSDLSVAQEMEGSGISPLDVDMFNRTGSNHPGAIELVEMKVDLGELPAPSNNEMSSFEPFGQLEQTASGPGSRPIAFEGFMEENYPNYEGNSPEFDEIMFGEEEAMGGMDWAALGGEMAEWGSAAFMGTLDAVVGSVAGAAMGLVYMSPLIAISELVPIVAKLVKGNWWIKDYDKQEQNYEYQLARLGSIMGTYWQLADQIEYLYRDTPKYVWFRDNGLAPLPGS